MLDVCAEMRHVCVVVERGEASESAEGGSGAGRIGMSVRVESLSEHEERCRANRQMYE